MAAATSSIAPEAIRHLYRELLRHVRTRPDKKNSALAELQSSFRRPLDPQESVALRVQAAESRLAVLRMTSSAGTRNSKGGTWVYRNGEKLSAESGTLRDTGGRVVSSFDGKNLDPESVKRHRQQLKRAGFVNNAHAKGFF